MDDLATRLGRVRHFHGLPNTALHDIVAAGIVRRFSAGTMIFQEGEPCAGMFVLLTGRVHLCKSGPRGQQQIIAIITPVIMFNEVAVLDGGANPVMALAVEDSVTWNIGCQAFHLLLQTYPQVGLGLLPILAARNRVLIAHYEDISYRSVLARTAKLLMALSDGGQRNIARSEHPVEEMAARIGSGREPLSRALRALRESGVIQSSRRTISITLPLELARLAHVEHMKE